MNDPNFWKWKEEIWISPKIISSRLDVSAKTARRLIAAGQFVAAKFGQSLRVSNVSFHDYVDRMVYHHTKNPNRIKEYNRKYRRGNAEQFKKELCDWNLEKQYLKGLISNNTGIERRKITNEMINLKKEQITLFREIKKAKEVLNGTT